MVHVSISITTRLSCLPASQHPMTPSLPLVRLPTHGPTTVVQPKPPTIQVQRQEPSNDYKPQTLHRASEITSLAHGSLHSVHVVHRCRHGLDHYSEVPDIG